MVITIYIGKTKHIPGDKRKRKEIFIYYITYIYRKVCISLIYIGIIHIKHYVNVIIVSRETFYKANSIV